MERHNQVGFRLHISRRLARNRDKTRFRPVLKLAVTSFGPNEEPAIVLDQLKHFTNLHVTACYLALVWIPCCPHQHN